MTFFLFDDFRFDSLSKTLHRGEKTLPIRPKSAEILGCLLERSEEVVSKEFFLNTYWPDTSVSENAVFQCIKEIRSALASSAPGTVFIKTFPKSGYQWVYQDTRHEPAARRADAPAAGDGKICSSAFTTGVSQERRRPWRLWGGLSFLAAIMVLFLVVSQSNRKGSSPAADPKPQTVAVFGFKNLAPDPQGDWLSEAFAESVRAEINQYSRFEILSGERIQRLMRDLDLTHRERFESRILARIQSHTHCDFAVTGSYVFIGGQLRVQWFLHDLAGTPMQSSSYSGDQTKLVSVLNRVARDIGTGLGLEEPQLAEAPVALPHGEKALRYYIEGLNHQNQGNVKEAIAFLERALLEEAGSVPILIALSKAYGHLGYQKKAQEVAAAALDNSPSEDRKGHLWAKANLHQTREEWQSASAIYKALWTFDPQMADYGMNLVNTQIQAGEADAAFETLAALGETHFASDIRFTLFESKAASLHGDHQRQLQAANRVVAHAQRVGARFHLAEGFMEQSEALFSAGDNKRALQSAEKASRLYSDLGDFNGYATAVMQKGEFHQKTGTYKKAERHFKDALGHYQRLGNLIGMAEAQHRLGAINLITRDYPAAETFTATAIEHFRKSGSNQLANSLSNMGLIKIRQKDFKAAAAFIGEANLLYEKMGNSYRLATNNANLGIIALHEGDPQKALKHYESAATMARKAGKRNELDALLNNLAQLSTKNGEFKRARGYLMESLSLVEETGRPMSRAIVLYRLGNLDTIEGDGFTAAERFREAGSIFLHNDSPNDAARMGLALAKLKLNDGDPTGSKQLFETEFSRLDSSKSGYLVDFLTFKAELDLARGAPDEAQLTAEKAIAEARRIKNSFREIPAHLVEGRAQLNLGNLEMARQGLERAKALQSKVKDILVKMETGLFENQIHLAEGQLNRAKEGLEKLHQQAETLGAKELATRIKKTLLAVPSNGTLKSAGP